MNFDHVTPEFLVLGLSWYAAFILAITCHEAAHALAAHLMGDSTAHEAGQVTLNPLPHIEREPIGTVVVPILFYLMNGYVIGWASAPYDPAWGVRYPMKALKMALAGPLANLLLAVLAGLALRIGASAAGIELSGFEVLKKAVDHQLPATPVDRIFMFGSIVFMLNVLLFVFNLMPFPPLDGSAIWPVVLAPRYLAVYYQYCHQPAFMIMGLIVASSLLARAWIPVFLRIWDAVSFVI
ncbi:MAG: site-2 protease family protein [Planctomycetota bacterium]|nr:site-2 protease family protein [Planctomycetota bacterium]